MMRLLHTDYQPIMSDTEPVMCSSFSRCVEFMNKYDCMFITAFRSEYSHKENRRRNKQLAMDIHNSDLTYIKALGGFVETLSDGTKQRVTEETFCIVNNGYTTEDFIKLAIEWCGKYEQEAVLVTSPHQDKTRNYALNIVGTYYTASGSVDMEFDHANIGDVEEYFTNICGKDFVLSSTQIFATDLMPFATVNGRRMASIRFARKYPEL